LCAAAPTRSARAEASECKGCAKLIAVELRRELLAAAGESVSVLRRHLPFPDESFGAVGISFGMLHFPHPERALAEAFCVLQPGGRIAFTVWATPDKAVGFAMVLKAIEAHGRAVKWPWISPTAKSTPFSLR
jgi:SAM-dependent methyltransferase